MNIIFNQDDFNNKVVARPDIKAEMIIGTGVYPRDDVQNILTKDVKDQMYGEIRERLTEFVTERHMCDDAREELEAIIKLTQ